MPAMNQSDVAEWGVRIAAQLPSHSFVRVLLLPRLPHPSEGAAGRCPKCGRSLPVFSFPTARAAPGFEPMGLGTYTDHERTLQCLVDGFNSKHGRDVALSVLLDAVSRLAGAMERKGWVRDASRLRDALDVPDEGVRAEHVGQELVCQQGHLFRREAGDAPLSFAASLARYWPTSSS